MSELLAGVEGAFGTVKGGAAYSSPRLVEYGSVHRVTMGTGCAQGDGGSNMAMTPPGQSCPGG